MVPSPAAGEHELELLGRAVDRGDGVVDLPDAPIDVGAVVLDEVLDVLRDGFDVGEDLLEPRRGGRRDLLDVRYRVLDRLLGDLDGPVHRLERLG